MTRAISATLLLLCAFTAGARAASVAIPAAADTTLYQSSTGALANGMGQYLFGGVTNSNGARRILLRFDVSAYIPAGASIVSAGLTLYQSRSKAGEEVFTLHRMLHSWNEGTTVDNSTGGGGALLAGSDATWLHASAPGDLWTAPGATGDYVTDPASSALVTRDAGPITWNGLEGEVAAMLANPAGNAGWILLGNETISGQASRFNSRQSPDTNTRPVLVVEFIVPEPGCACLLAGAGLLLLNRRRSAGTFPHHTAVSFQLISSDL